MALVLAPLVTMYSLRYYLDSWIEVSSQPSSSSLSSAATNEDIVTTGLRVEGLQPNPHHRSRRRRLEHLAAATAPPLHYSREPSVASSSQDEYEESSSESDRVMTSSNEDITTQPREPLFLRAGSAAPDAAPSSDEDDDDNSTALGMRVSSSPFVPQPNAFTHPPASETSSRTRAAADVPLPSPTVVSSSSRRTATRHNSYSSARTSRRQQQHSPYNMISPSYQADHDAALRASLSTLLSYATAARGLPKNDTQPHERSPTAAQPSTFRLVPESVAMGEDNSTEEARPSGQSTDNQPSAPNRFEKSPRSATTGSSNASSAPKQKRRTSSKDRSSAHASPPKKSRRANLTDSVSNVSPTLMTWVISAGVVVLFSAISFSAGYALGREVGRTEGSWMGEGGAGALSGTGPSTGCGREAVKGGLKRLRWGAAAGSSISA